MARDLDIIQTERLILRGINETDAIKIVEWRSNPEVYRFFKAPHKITVREHVAWYHNSYLSNENRFDWMCIEQSSGKRIGVFGLARDEDLCEVNYLLAPEAQHKGFAAEAIKSLMNYAAKNWGIRHVVAEIHKNNQQSIALVLKLGFKIISQNDPFAVYGIEV